VLVPNQHYWDTSVGVPRLKTLTLIGVPDPGTLTSGIESGAITGAYPYPLTRLSELAASAQASVYFGPPASTVALAVSATTGPLANVAVRQALSLAIDRPRLIADVFGGAAQIPHALMGSGTWGYARDTFSAAYAALPAMTMDVARARALIGSAHASGQTIRLATATQDPTLAAEAQAVATAASAIGLKVRLVAVSPAAYVQFFTDPKAWQSVDGFISTNYGDYADPAAFYKTIALAGGTQNFNDWSDPTVTALLDRAQATASPVVRARDTVEAQALITRDQVWIPLVLPDTVLLLHRGATGPPATFSYMFAPWGVRLGGT
jgi:peptide/nickel transport system substrate-binding protein